jgi:hypothetical protein
MIRFVQHFSLLCCFFLLFLLQDDHLNAHSAALQAPNPQHQQPPSMIQAAETSLQDIYDIYGPVPLPEPPPYGLYALLATAGVLLAGLIFFIQRRFAGKETAQIDPAAAARAELSRAETLLEQAEIGAYCDRISALLKGCIERLSGSRVDSRTSSESLESLHRSGQLDSSEIDMLSQCFNICDAVKFRRYSPAPEEIEILGRLTRALVLDKDADTTGGRES